MRIVVDAMGGDNAPAVEVEGALEALRHAESDLAICLVGDETSIRRELDRLGFRGDSRLTVEHAPEKIDMGGEDPARQVRKKKGASITVATRLLREGQADGLVSAGNTGAVVASALLTLGRIRGVRRPGIATVLPSPSGGAVILDVGANSDCSPRNLLQFATMGAIYARKVLGRTEPRVGLLNIGEEKSKGNKVVQEAHKLLEESSLRFVGNVEGRDIFHGATDVVVCDGFVGNVVLKFSESVISLITNLAKEEIGHDLRGKLGALMLRPSFRNISRVLSYDEYGGAPLLGIDGIVIIAHGKSTVKAIRNAILVAVRFARERINDTIRDELQEQSLGQVPA
ncbi:MAG: phosphate acyltransferase PlsX [bacterium]